MKKPEGKNLRDSPFKDEQRRNAPFLDLTAGLHEGAVIFTFITFLGIYTLPCLSWDPGTQKLQKKIYFVLSDLHVSALTLYFRSASHCGQHFLKLHMHDIFIVCF
jgi:hypothetical protein